MAKKLKDRFAVLLAAGSLIEFWPPYSGPERCHELKGNRRGTFSMDLNQPFRLLFKPIEDVTNTNHHDEKERWDSITRIDLIGIEDTHG